MFDVTHSTQEPMVWRVDVTPKPDAGLFYVRWWGDGSTRPIEHQFSSRKEAAQKMNEFLRLAPYVKIEFLEAVEWGSRARGNTK